MEFNKIVTHDTGGLGGGDGDCRDGGTGNGLCCLSMPAMKQTSALEYSVRGRGRGRLLAPPFLTKIYEMVDNPGTNSVISWGSNNTSFVISDQIKFAAELLPKYFKHNNFSSFVYQLNNYGFRKISWDKLEYENPWFQAGKEHWLQNIKRRNQQSEPEITLQQTSFVPSDDFAKARMDAELETLRTEQNSMRVEIQKLKEQHEEMENEFKAFQGSTIFTDSKHGEMVIPLLAQQLIQHLKEKREMDSSQTTKKQKLASSERMDILKDPTDKEETLRQNADGKDQDQEELNEMQPEGEIISSPDDSGSSNKKQKDDSTSGIADNCAFWKKILEDDSEQEERGEQKTAEPHPKIIIKLEDLMAANSPNEGENLETKALNNKVEEGGEKRTRC